MPGCQVKGKLPFLSFFSRLLFAFVCVGLGLKFNFFLLYNNLEKIFANYVFSKAHMS